MFSAFLPHHHTTTMLFRFRGRSCLIRIVLSQVLLSFDAARRHFSIHTWVPRLLALFVLVQQSFSSYPWEGRTPSVSFVVFKRGGEGGCRRKAKVRFLSFPSTRQLYGAPPSLQRLIQYKYCLKDTECAWKLKSHGSYFGSIYFAARYCFVLSFNLPQQQ